MTDAPHSAVPVDTDATLDALGSRVPRAILVAASRQPTTVAELAETCDVSESTIYRHLGRLVEAGLVRKEGRADSETAPTYRTVADSLAVDVDADGITVVDDRTDEFERALRTVVSHLDVRNVDYDVDADAVTVRLNVAHRDTSELVDLCRRLLECGRSEPVSTAGGAVDIVTPEN